MVPGGKHVTLVHNKGIERETFCQVPNVLSSSLVDDKVFCSTVYEAKD
jgi:hypothetical protein